MSPGVLFDQLGREIPLGEVAAIRSASDSRRQMDFLKKIAEALKLEGDLTEDQVLEAVKARAEGPSLKAVAEALGLKADADETAVLAAISERPAEKNLEDRAKEEGKVLLDGPELLKLQEQASAGAAAAAELHANKFEVAFVDAVRTCKVAPVAKDEYKGLYEKAPEQTLALLDKLPANGVARTEATGHGETPAEGKTEGEAERAALDARVKARMQEKGEDYITALDHVRAVEEDNS